MLFPALRSYPVMNTKGVSSPTTFVAFGTRFLTFQSPVAPYTNIFRRDTDPGPSTAVSAHLVLQAHVVNVQPHSVTLDRAFPELGFPTTEISFEYLIYALGSHLPSPIDLWSEDESLIDSEEDEEGEQPSVREKYRGTKAEGIAWMKRCQDRVAKAKSVLVVGGRSSRDP